MNLPSPTVLRHVPADHPSFAGHFPGQPLLPGVVLLAEVMEALSVGPAPAAGTQWVVDAVKFLAPVGPGTDLRIEVQSPPPAQPGAHRFDVLAHDLHRGWVTVARGQMSAGDPA